MKSRYLVILALIFTNLGTFGQTKSAPRAKLGETVYVVLNPVKANKRAQFERFIHEILWAHANKLSQEEQKAFRQTRVLHPAKPEKDGTYSYIFLMDPYIEGADYSFLSLLIKMYGQPKAKEYYELYRDAIAGRQISYKVIQSKD